MKRALCLLAVLVAAPFFLSTAGHCEDDVYYTRCNLKVLPNNELTWINWQMAPSSLPFDTKVKVTKGGKKATLVDAATNTAYKLDIGAEGDPFLEKFVTKKPVDIKKFPQDIQSAIRTGTVRIGMTKEQVYIAMGPPAKVGTVNTNAMNYENILAADLWIFARRRASKNIGVVFDAGTGKVTRTEGL
jgi:hypothetical protein